VLKISLCHADLRSVSGFRNSPSSAPRCGEPLRIIAVIRNPLTAAAILSSLGLPARAPPQVQPSFEELDVEL